MFEREYRDLSHVPRWGIIPVIKRQSVAEHSYYVTLYASHIMFKLNIDPKYTLPTLYHCLEHDRSEVYTSDIPGPVKRNIVDKDKETVFEIKGDLARFETNKFDKERIPVAIRKMADLMDEYMYWKEEGVLGNGRAGQMLKIVDARLRDATETCGEATGNIVEIWDRVYEPFIRGAGTDKVIPPEAT